MCNIPVCVSSEMVQIINVNPRDNAKDPEASKPRQSPRSIPKQLICLCFFASFVRIDIQMDRWIPLLTIAGIG